MCSIAWNNTLAQLTKCGTELQFILLLNGNLTMASLGLLGPRTKFTTLSPINTIESREGTTLSQISEEGDHSKPGAG